MLLRKWVSVGLGLKQGSQVVRGSQCPFCVSHQTHSAFQAEMESFVVFAWQPTLYATAFYSKQDIL